MGAAAVLTASAGALGASAHGAGGSRRSDGGRTRRRPSSGGVAAISGSSSKNATRPLIGGAAQDPLKCKATVDRCWWHMQHGTLGNSAARRTCRSALLITSIAVPAHSIRAHPVADSAFVLSRSTRTFNRLCSRRFRVSRFHNSTTTVGTAIGTRMNAAHITTILSFKASRCVKPMRVPGA